MNIALLQLNPTVGALESNRKALQQAHQRALDAGAQCVVANELALSGYPPRDLLLKRRFVADCMAELEQLAATIAEVPLVVGSIAPAQEGRGNPLYNAVFVLQKGQIQHQVNKRLLPNYDVFDEQRYFRAADKQQPVELCGYKLGLSICEDIWTEQYLPAALYGGSPVMDLVAQGAQCILNVSASPFASGKQARRQAMVSELAASFATPIVYCNAVGGNDQLIFDGNSFAVAANGSRLVQLAAFEEDMALVELEMAPGEDSPQPQERSSRAQTEQAYELHSGAKSTASKSAASKSAASKGAQLSASAAISQTPACIAKSLPSLEELRQALVLGLRDYVHKCGFRRVVLGLSGGIDSALCAALAVDALGGENVHGLLLPSEISSAHSLADAKALCANLGMSYDVVPIASVVDGASAALSEVFTGRVPDVTEENMQARARGLLLMAYANKFGALLLTTGNKSELAVGYCTMYGDMCGGLAVISDLLKTQVYALARWINRDGERIPKNSIEKPPSAELREGQQDQDSLPDYAVLDAILEAYVERNTSTEEIIERGVAPAEVVRWVCRQVDMNEWKRQQAAPGLRVSTRAFGMGRRLPIANGYKGR